MALWDNRYTFCIGKRSSIQPILSTEQRIGRGRGFRQRSEYREGNVARICSILCLSFMILKFHWIFQRTAKHSTFLNIVACTTNIGGRGATLISDESYFQHSKIDEFLWGAAWFRVKRLRISVLLIRVHASQQSIRKIQKVTSTSAPLSQGPFIGTTRTGGHLDSDIGKTVAESQISGFQKY